jgi:hypothetical protein
MSLMETPPFPLFRVEISNGPTMVLKQKEGRTVRVGQEPCLCLTSALASFFTSHIGPNNKSCWLNLQSILRSNFLPPLWLPPGLSCQDHSNSRMTCCYHNPPPTRPFPSRGKVTVPPSDIPLLPSFSLIPPSLGGHLCSHHI